MVEKDSSGYWRADLHVHVGPRHGVLPKEITRAARQAGLDLVGAVDHDKTPSVSSLPFEGIVFLRGSEVSSAQGHVQVLNTDDSSQGTIPMARSLVETVDRARAQGKKVIISHLGVGVPPISIAPETLIDLYQRGRTVDGIETQNPRFTTRHKERTKALADDLKISAVGSSDAHFRNYIGQCYTLIPKVTGDPKTDLLLAIRDRTTQALESDRPRLSVPTAILIISYITGLFYNLGDKVKNVPGFVNTLLLLRVNQLKEVLENSHGNK